MQMARIQTILWLSAIFLFPACTRDLATGLGRGRERAPVSTARSSGTPAGDEPAVAALHDSGACPRTTAADSTFVAPAEQSTRLPSSSEFWFGSEALWTRLPADGTWSGLPTDGLGYGQKTFWWSTDFHLAEELQPALSVIGRRIDGKAPPLVAERATNASAADIGDAMLAGVVFPTKGCWEVTGSYRGAALTFVVEILD